MTVAEVMMMYTATLMILLKPRHSTAADTTDKHLLSRDQYVDVTVSPPAPQLMFVGTELRISIVVTSADNSTCERQRSICDVAMSVSSYRPTTVVALSADDPLRPDGANNTLTGLHFRLNHSVVLVVHALSIGRAVLTFEISSDNRLTDNKIAMSTDNAVDIQYTSVRDDIESAASSRSANGDVGRQLFWGSRRSHPLAVIEYHITVARRRRPIDDGFFWAVAAATLMNAFGLGCVTVYNDVKTELRKLQPSVLATLLCQFVILPPVRLPAHVEAL